MVPSRSPLPLTMFLLACSSDTNSFLREQQKLLKDVYAMQRVPSGDFVIGCTTGQDERCWGDEPVREITLTQPFLMGETEVTQGLYESLMDSNPSWDTDCGASCPVEDIEWYDAVQFANALSVSMDLPECYSIDGALVDLPNGLHCGGFRLPTEAEWEVAARGGKDWMYSGSDNANDVAWFGGHPYGGIHPVARKQANAYGLYDMSGNVWEWTWDEYSELPDTTREDPVVDEGRQRVIRGGSWCNDHTVIRVAVRASKGPELGFDNLGVRLVLAAALEE